VQSALITTPTHTHTPPPPPLLLLLLLLLQAALNYRRRRRSGTFRTPHLESQLSSSNFLNFIIGLNFISNIKFIKSQI